jgi:hypothetical protein
LLTVFGEDRAPRFFGVAEDVGDELTGFIVGRAGFHRGFRLRRGAGASEQTHDELRAADEIGDDTDDDGAEAKLHAAAAHAGASAAVVLDVLTLFTLAPTHAADVSRRPRGNMRAS